MDRLRVGVIGVGSHGRKRHLQPYLELGSVEVVGVCDTDQKRVAQVAGELGLRGYTDHHEFLEREQPDAVSVVTPTGLHAEIAIDCLRSNAHVLVDKPLASSYEQALAVVREAEARGRVLMVGYWSRFSPALKWAMSVSREGALGNVYAAHASIVRRRGIPGSPTFIDQTLSGGHGSLLDIGCYALDNTLAILGFPKPISVSGATYTVFGSKEDEPQLNWGSWDTKNFGLEDYAVGFVRFEGGLTMTLEAAWAANVSHIGELQAIRVLGDQAGLDAKGSEAISEISMHGKHGGALTDTKPVLRQEGVDSLARRMVADFVRSIVSQGSPEVTGRHSLVVQAVIQGIYESAKAGRELRVPPLH
jgi:predicted dehydrogenase